MNIRWQKWISLVNRCDSLLCFWIWSAGLYSANWFRPCRNFKKLKCLYRNLVLFFFLIDVDAQALSSLQHSFRFKGQDVLMFYSCWIIRSIWRIFQCPFFNLLKFFFNGIDKRIVPKSLNTCFGKFFRGFLCASPLRAIFFSKNGLQVAPGWKLMALCFF